MSMNLPYPPMTDGADIRKYLFRLVEMLNSEPANTAPGDAILRVTQDVSGFRPPPPGWTQETHGIAFVVTAQEQYFIAVSSDGQFFVGVRQGQNSDIEWK